MDALSELVLKCQQHPEDEALREQVRQKTMELFYRLPNKYHLIEEEHCASFLLYCEASIDRYIDMFVPMSNYGYYIMCIIRKRIIPFKQLMHEEEGRNRSVMFVSASPIQYHGQAEELCGGALYRQDELPAVYQTLLSQGPTTARGRHPAIRSLLRALHRGSCRRGLLLSSVMDPSYALEHHTALISRLLGCEEHLLIDFLASFDQLLFTKRQEYNAHLERIGFRFFQINCYRRKITETKRKKSRKKIQTRYRFNVSTWEKDLEELEKRKQIFISKSQLGQILGLPTSSIHHNITAWRHAMRDALDASTTKDYLE
ncbi:MAG: hypothetical protein SPF89_07695 [Sphaerochaetaceae bacterium]|nr:hypothetical protein [Spirochaetales bacterium]MDY5499970.1 hypothetical protein [Sphaerochaetaceae bacterium]